MDAHENVFPPDVCWWCRVQDGRRTRGYVNDLPIGEDNPLDVARIERKIALESELWTLCLEWE